MVVLNGGFLEGDLYFGVIGGVFVGVLVRVMGMLLLHGGRLISKVQGRSVKDNLSGVLRGMFK